jgi:hypothetical protein
LHQRGRGPAGPFTYSARGGFAAWVYSLRTPPAGGGRGRRN